MGTKTRSIAISAITSIALLGGLSSLGATAAEPVRIGIIADLSGPYSALAGPGVVVGVNMAVNEFGGKVLGRPIEVLAADSLLKSDVAVAKAREWYDRQNVQMIIEASDSATAVALQKLGVEKQRITMFMSGSTALTNKECSPYGVHYAWDTYALANGTARAITQAGGDSWYFITANYVFGKSLESDTSNVVQRLGGKVAGSVNHPLNSQDFASFLLSAQQSNAKIVALANAGRDTQTAVRQAVEFGLTAKQKVVPLMLFDTDVKGMGLDITHGLQFTTGFYWDFDEKSRAFSKQFFEQHKGMPTMDHAGAYSATLQYLKAVAAAKTLDAAAVMKELKNMKLEDAFSRNGRIREDGRMEHDMYLVEVKKPSESTGPWDLLKVKQVIPAHEAFAPLSQSTCALVKK